MLQATYSKDLLLLGVRASLPIRNLIMKRYTVWMPRYLKYFEKKLKTCSYILNANQV